MKKVENVNIHFGDKIPENPVVIHILEGQLPEPIITNQPNNLLLEGDILSPRVFLDNTEIDLKRNIVRYSDDPDNIFIQFYEHPENQLARIVIGRLKKNPDLSAFYFNQKGVFTNDTFIDTIKKLAYCFKSKDEAKKLIRTLSNFKARFSTEVEKLDDKKGNTSNSLSTVLDIEKGKVPEEITFSMPLFDGTKKVDFTVDVEIDVVTKDNAPQAKFGFFTMDLMEMQRKEAKSIIDDEIEFIGKSGITCIRVNK